MHTHYADNALDVQLTNLTKLVHQEENHEVILQCNITGLHSDFDIKFIHMPRCEHQPHGQTELKKTLPP